MCESGAKSRAICVKVEQNLEQYVGKDFAPLFPKVDKVDLVATNFANTRLVTS
jgi:hypothetical protein